MQICAGSLSEERLNTTKFIAYDFKLFDILGVVVTTEHVAELAYQTHEAACLIPGTGMLFFVEWGPSGGDDGVHDWQYVLDTSTNEVR